MAAQLILTVRPHPVSAWFLRPTAEPVVLVDGTEHRARWNKRHVLELAEGTYTVSAGLRYRGTKPVLGTKPLQVTLTDGRSTELVAVNGLLNHSPFTLSAP